jgi:hypothetical protein
MVCALRDGVPVGPIAVSERVQRLPKILEACQSGILDGQSNGKVEAGDQCTVLFPAFGKSFEKPVRLAHKLWRAYSPAVVATHG